MKKIAFVLLSILLIGCTKPPNNKLDLLIPQAETIKKSNSEFDFSGDISLLCNTEFNDIKEILSNDLAKVEGIRISEKTKKTIQLKKIEEENYLGNEGYVLDITSNSITISGNDVAGVFYGVQTLMQLISLDASINIPCATITDKPAYGYRGFMLDVARRFYPKDNLFRIIDLIAFYKINVLQLHLTDDQGWRIEIESLPKLTKIGSVPPDDVNLKGGFYTKEDMREIIEYATLRNVEIIPEIDLPGHSMAANAAYQNITCFGDKVGVRGKNFNNIYDTLTSFSYPFCVGKEENYVFLGKIIKEIAELFPSKYIHLGGDECSEAAWRICPLCKAVKEKYGYKNEDELQGYFMRRAEEIVKANGKIAIGWDEVYETDVPKSFNIMAWREEIWGVDAANDDYKVIMAPSHYYYLSRPQDAYKERHYGVLTPLPFMYKFEIPYEKIDPQYHNNIIGLQTCFWGGDDMDGTMNKLFPRFLVFSEHSWAGEERDLNSFMQKLSAQYKVMDDKGINYYVEHPAGLYDDVCITDDYTVELSVPIDGAEIRYTTDGSEPTQESELYTEAFDVPVGTNVKAKTFLPNGKTSVTVEGISKKVELMPAIEVENIENGIKLKIARGAINTTVDFEKANEVFSGVVEKIEYPGDSLRHNFALSFSGYIKIPEEGVYSFYSQSCDGSNLYIDDFLSVSNDFKHPKLTFAKSIALAKGYHKIKLNYFYSSIFEKFFSLEIEGPGIERQEVLSDMLFH